MRRVRATVAMLCVTALAAGGMIAVRLSSRETAAQVRTARVVVGTVENVVALSGQVRYEQEYAALAPWAGMVAQVYVRPGDAVTEGQALFRMDDSAVVSAVSAAYGAGAEQLAKLTGTAEAAQAQMRLDGLTVRALADGLVQQVSVKPLDGVTAGTAAVLLTSETQRVVCAAALRDAAKIKPGMATRVLVGGVAVCGGRVQSVGAAQTDQRTGQVVCEVTLVPEGYIDLPLGAAVEAEVIVSGAEGVTVLPCSAVTAEDSVWWIADGCAWEMPVAVPLRDEVCCWVSLPAGLAVVDAPAGLTHGQPVTEVTP
ncbi:MAG: biotin/lipoyl-binding protein [Clostridia bacterium]|nr:biotin/lipoyl-binding protein [Clostridia bacterium]